MCNVQRQKNFNTAIYYIILLYLKLKMLLKMLSKNPVFPHYKKKPGHLSSRLHLIFTMYLVLIFLQTDQSDAVPPESEYSEGNEEHTGYNRCNG